MRISTAAYHANALATMLTQQAELARTQAQVASGKRVNTPADDPIASAHIIELERAQSESEQFIKNGDLARSRLTLEEQALADTGTALQRVRELVLQASNTATLTSSDRQSIATEIETLKQELTNIANRKDGGGEYIFAGYSTMTKPFGEDGTGVVQYAGDQGNRLVQIGPAQRIADGHSGFDVFMNITEGNGTFVTSAGNGNTGSGIISTGSIVNPTLWQPGVYTVTFSPPTQWSIVDAANNAVASGAYSPGGTIAFNGIEISVTGSPANGDTFTIETSGTQDIFSTLDGIATELRASGMDQVSTAQLSSALGASLQQIDQTADHLLRVRGEVGARLSQLDNAEQALENYKIELASALSDLRDLDYAEAITRMTQQVTGLQAAQASYAKISQLSLFNYL